MTSITPPPDDRWSVRQLTAVVVFLVCLVMALCCSSCGSTTRAVIKAGDSATSTSITITTNNPSSMEISPTVEANISTNPKN